MMNPTTQQKDTAHTWVNPDTHEHYHFSLGQYTLYPTDKYLPLLTDKGKQLYETVMTKVRNGEYKGEIVEYSLNWDRSGPWFAKPESRFYGTAKTPDSDSTIQGCYNCRDNITITGKTADGKPITTSCCIFICDQEGQEGQTSQANWCYTLSGSLYKLGKKTGSMGVL